MVATMIPGTGNCRIKKLIMAVKHVFPPSVDGSEHSLLRLVSLVGPTRKNLHFGTLAGWGTIGHIWILASGLCVARYLGASDYGIFRL